jgi:hypothetical protein
VVFNLLISSFDTSGIISNQLISGTASPALVNPIGNKTQNAEHITMIVNLFRIFFM